MLNRDGISLLSSTLVKPELVRSYDSKAWNYWQNHRLGFRLKIFIDIKRTAVEKDTGIKATQGASLEIIACTLSPPLIVTFFTL